MFIKIRQILVTLIILFASSIFIDEGMTIMLIGENLKIHLKPAHHNDLEIPHQHNHHKHIDDERLVSNNKPDLSCPDTGNFVSAFICCILPQDFSYVIWQPPKSL